MNLAKALEEFQEVDLPDDARLDTSFADQFLKTFTRMARAQLKTQQTVSLAADDVREHLQRQEEILSELKQQREALRAKNEQLVRFILDASDLIMNFYSSTRDARDSTIGPIAETMYRALETQMEKVGLSRIPSLGQVPDALYHFVLDTRAVDSPHKRDTIVDIVREGYTLDGVVIRKADVVVGK